MSKWRVVIEGDGAAFEPTPDSAPYTVDALTERFVKTLSERNHTITLVDVALVVDAVPEVVAEVVPDVVDAPATRSKR